jgi:transposase InsO family protein
VLDDFSRYILAWKLYTTMTATDVADSVAMALRCSGLERVLLRPVDRERAGEQMILLHPGNQNFGE